MSRSWLWLCAVGLLLTGGCRLHFTPDSSDTPPTSRPARLTETPLDRWPEPERSFPRSVVSPDGLHAARVTRRGLGYTLVYDGQPGPAWSEIGGVLELQGCMGFNVCGKFSDDSQHFLYWGRRGGLWHLVYDGRPGPGCPGDKRSAPSFVGPVKGHCAIRVTGRDESYWIVDGQEQPRYSSLYGQLQFSPDGLHYAYVAGTRHGPAIIHDGKLIGQVHSYGPSFCLTFSPDGKRLAYVTSVSVPPHQNTTAPLIVVDEEPVFVGHPEAEIRTLGFSPRWGTLCWVETSRKGQTWVASGGVYGPTYPRVDAISFGPATSGLMYVGYPTEGQAELVSGGHVMARAEDFAPIRPIRRAGLSVSNDLPTDAFNGGTDEYPMYLVKRKGLWQVEPGGMEPGRRAIVQVASPITYIALRRDGKWILVDSGLDREPAFDEPLGPLVHSPKLGRVAYAVRLGDRLAPAAAHVVVDGEIGPAALMVSQPAFSADGKHVAYFARSGAQAWAVVDGVEGPKYSQILGFRQPVFQPEGLGYLAVRGDALLRVRHATGD
jgi:hypothetical protein